MLVLSMSRSASDGWNSLAEAIHGAGFTVINSHPVKSEMAVATPKSAVKEPIAFDIILVCRKQPGNPTRERGAEGNPTRPRGVAHTNPKRQRGESNSGATRGQAPVIATSTISDGVGR